MQLLENCVKADQLSFGVQSILVIAVLYAESPHTTTVPDIQKEQFYTKRKKTIKKILHTNMALVFMNVYCI